jgi:hypothetical protein
LKILVALRAAQGKSATALNKDDSFQLPRIIPAGDGGTIQIPKKIDDNFARLARELKVTLPRSGSRYAGRTAAHETVAQETVSVLTSCGRRSSYARIAQQPESGASVARS